MPTRSEAIRKAASLPKGTQERREILAYLSKTAKIEVNLRSDDRIIISVRVRLDVWKMTLKNLRGPVADVNDNVRNALKMVEVQLSSAGVTGISWDVPVPMDLGLTCGRAGLLVDWGYVIEVDPVSYKAAYPDKWGVVGDIVTKAFRSSGIKV